MSIRILRFVSLFIVLGAFLFIATSTAGTRPANAAADFAADRYLVKGQKGADGGAVRASIERAGGRIVNTIPQLDLYIVHGLNEQNRAMLESESLVAGMARDSLKSIVEPSMQRELWGTDPHTFRNPEKIKIQAPNLAVREDDIVPDPSFELPETMWNVYRLFSTEAWKQFGGGGADVITVGVADTGLDFTHVDLADNVIHVNDFTYLEEPYNICRDFFGLPTDEELADMFGGPVSGDWNGHGSWIGGNIAGVLNDTGMNGIVPNVKLVGLKIAGSCGSAFDSEILAAITYAGDQNIDVVNISFGGFQSRATDEGEFAWQQYRAAVAYANSKGTMIVASAGNSHVEVGKHGKVKSHGVLTLPGDPLVDPFGLYVVPGGIPGVVMVSALTNITAPASASCPTGTFEENFATCKRASDTHQPIGKNRYDQLAYYSNYGKRITLSAPGGARKFNLPGVDGGGTPGFPYTPEVDGTFVYQIFSATSNWATQIPCFDLSSMPGFTDDCYTAIQGTSMSAPHVVAAAAQVLSARPDLRKLPKTLAAHLRATARNDMNNRTPPLSATDTTPADRTGVACPTAYCHLGGDPIPHEKAYGDGLVDVESAIIE